MWYSCINVTSTARVAFTDFRHLVFDAVICEYKKRGPAVRRRERVGEPRMATFEKPKSADQVPLDLLPVIRSSGVLGDRQLAEIKTKVLQGDYPFDSAALAERLVRDNILTAFQAKRFLSNRPQGLIVGPVHHPRPRRLGLDGAGLPGAPCDDGPGGRAQDHRAGDLVERAGGRAVSA